MPRRNQANVDIKVDDKGSLKKVGTSAHSADRRLKGAAQASSNTSKNFSKMAQGISGGLVPAYATLAASLFAVDAVFRALKEAADMRVLIEGQQAFAATTGVAMTSVAKNIVKATEAQISFKEASQAAAIGFAAGLSAEQMERLGKAATSTAKILGRDTADAFDRLTRGVIKAEPEVLDELGIILRLDIATEKYARTLGLTAKDLTTFEKSQAVLNEVLEQAEGKYEAVAESIKPNTYQQLAVAFTQLLEAIQVVVSPYLEKLASFLAGNVAATAAVSLIFFGSILKGLIPTTAEVAARGVEKFQAIEQSILEAKNAVTALKAEQQGMTERSGMAMGGAGKIAKQAGVVDKRTTAGKLAAGQVISAKQAKAEILRIEKSKNGKIHGMNKKQTLAYKSELKKIVKETQSATQKQAGFFKSMTLKWKIAMNKMKIKHKDTWMSMQATANKFTRGMTKAMSAAGYIGMFILFAQMVVSAAKAVANFLNPPSAQEIKLKEMLDEVTKSMKDVNKEVEKIIAVLPTTRESWRTAGDGVSFYANMLKNFPLDKMQETAIILEGMGRTNTIEFSQQLKDIEQNLEGMGLGFIKLNDPSDPRSAKVFIQEIRNAKGILVAGAGAIATVANEEEKLSKARKKRADAFKYEYKDEVQALTSIIHNLKMKNVLTQEETTLIEERENELKSILDIERQLLEIKQKRVLLSNEEAMNVGALAKFNKEMFKQQERLLKMEEIKVKRDKIKLDLGLPGADKNRLGIQDIDLQIQDLQLRFQNVIGALLDSFEVRFTLAVHNATFKGLSKGFEDLFLLKGDLGDLLKSFLTSISQAMAKSLAEETARSIMSAEIFGGIFTDVLGDAKGNEAREIQTQIMALQEEQRSLLEKTVNVNDEALKNFTDRVVSAGDQFREAVLKAIQPLAADPTAFDKKRDEFKDKAVDEGIKALSGSFIFSKGGTVPGYSSGGIVKGYNSGGKIPGTYAGRDTVPALLSPGEFVFTPKQLKAISGGNTVVNVNMDGSISGTQSDSNDAKALGIAIASAVNKEISKQKRIGGSLYTYGGGGI